MEMEIIGVYPVDAPEPCHLIECWVRDASGDFDIGAITQELADEPKDNWQTPWDEYILNDDGTAGELASSANAMNGDVRIAFFFHYLDSNGAIVTSDAAIPLPSPTHRPERLLFMEYESP